MGDFKYGDLVVLGSNIGIVMSDEFKHSFAQNHLWGPRGTIRCYAYRVLMPDEGILIKKTEHIVSLDDDEKLKQDLIKRTESREKIEKLVGELQKILSEIAKLRLN